MTKVQKRKKVRRIGPFLLMLAERTGLEPATPGVTGRYSNQLNYRSVYSDRFFRDKTSETMVGAERLELPT